jgi:hypothetical protein
VFAEGGPAGDSYEVLLRLTPGGGIAWSTRLPGPGPGGGSQGPRHGVALYGGNVYVVTATGNGPPAPTHVWRVGTSGALVTHRTFDVGGIASDVEVEANASGVVAAVRTDGAAVRVVGLDPGDLHVTAATPAVPYLSMASDATGTWVVGSGRCGSLLSRYDTRTLRRTGLWHFADVPHALSVAVHAGRPWLLRTDGDLDRAVALERYDLS